jgi:hypothetical protein
LPTQTGAAIAARDGAIGLAEGIGNPPLFLARHTDPSVGDGELKVDGQRFKARGGASQFHLDVHLTAICKLDGVADEVNDNLAEASKIAHESVGHGWLHSEIELKILLMSAEPECLQRLAEAVAERKVLGLQFRFWLRF